MTREVIDSPLAAAARRIASRFVDARLSGRALTEFPGPIPTDLTSAYACQDAAIALWPDEIAGWKIGRIPAELEPRLGQSRLAGPIFRRGVHFATPGKTVECAVFSGGFAAIEAEYVFEIAQDAPPGKTDWCLEESLPFAGRLFTGVEIASSPLATINALGPTVVVSDFGNNAGLVLGAAIEDWRERAFDTLRCHTFIENRAVGEGSVADLPGGPFEALRFLLEHCARRGRPLKAGALASTGAATGIHDVVPGQTARIDFGADGSITCRAVAAVASAQAARLVEARSSSAARRG